MFDCPKGDGRLVRSPIDGGVVWACDSCAGRAVGVGLIRSRAEPSYGKRLWGAVVERGSTGERPCPSCGLPMTVANVDGTTLDVCKRCQLVWFDPREYDSVPVEPVPDRPNIPQEALEEIGRLEANEIAESFRRRYPQQEVSLEDAAALASGALGLPVPNEPSALQRTPWATWLLVALVAIAGTFALFRPDLVDRLGLVPRDAFRYGGLTFVTAFFVQAGLFQLISNVYFLAVFGDDVEDFLGTSTFLLLLFVGAIAGESLHALLAGARSVPFAGAGAGISAITVFYGLRFPHAKLKYFWLGGWRTMPAYAAVLFWFLTKLLGGRIGVIGAPEPSPVSIVGGGAVGLLFWYLWRNDEAPGR